MRALEYGAGIVVGILVVATTWTTVYFLDKAAAQSTAALRISQVQASLGHSSHLSWEAVADAGSLAEVHRRGALIRLLLDEQLRDLAASGVLSAEQMGEIGTSIASYRDALDVEFALLDRGDTSAAQVFHDQSVEPLLEEATTLLATRAVALAEDSSSAMALTRTEAILLIPFSLIFAGVLGFRLTRQATVSRSLARFEAMASGASDMIMVTDSSGVVTYASPSVAGVLGGGGEDWVGTSILDRVHPDDVARLRAGLSGPLAVPASTEVEEVRMGTTGGEWRVVEHHVRNMVSTASIAGLVWNSRDVTGRRELEDELAHQAAHDPLTGLANRAAVGHEIARSLSAGHRSGRLTGVLMVDLDRFKGINDSLGHAIGDEVLRKAARRIESCTRGSDFVARPGGDEFIVVMREIMDATGAARVAQRIVEEFRHPFAVQRAEMYATASVGVAVSTGASGADDLVREADTALYVAKGAGRDRVAVFNEDLRGAITMRLEVEGALRHALDRDQFAIWYQPEVDLATGSVIAVEALLRWNHPDGSTWTAARFVEIAEDIGLIGDIGPWALAAVCAQGAAWAREFPDRRLIVRVNLSAHQLNQGDLVETIDHALGASGVDPGLLCVEITESVLLSDTTMVHDNLTALRSRGMHVALDDFGTKYASLTYLRQYPIDVLKIDRSFVTTITTNDHDRALVAGIIALAAHLGMAVTAEGVETQAQARCLHDLGCPGAQGFLYSPAVPADQVKALLEATFPHACEPDPDPTTELAQG